MLVQILRVQYFAQFLHKCYFLFPELQYLLGDVVLDVEETVDVDFGSGGWRD
jgi:hypothetical protein